MWNPWIIVTNTGCHGAQTKSVPIEASRDVDSQPSLPPLPRLCLRCLQEYGRKEELVLKISPRHDFMEILECPTCNYYEDTGRY